MATKRTSQKVRAAYLRARRRADRIYDRSAMYPIAQEYEKQLGRAATGLGRLFAGNLRDLVTMQDANHAVHWVQDWTKTMVGRVGSVMDNTTRATVTEGFEASSRLIAQLDGQSPLTDSMLAHNLGRRVPELQQLRGVSMRRVGNEVYAAVVAKTKRLLADNTTRVSDLITETAASLDQSTWRVARLVKTETSYAYNQAQTDAVDAANEELDDALYSRWTEMIDDVTMRHPMDNRVARDSFILHGQIALPGKAFTMPPNSVGVGKLRGRSWTHPPNRPNDRAVLVPWRKAWGVPAWIYQNGSKIRV